MGKREVAPFHKGMNGQERLYRGDEEHCQAHKEHSGLTEQIAYRHGGSMNHDLVKYFQDLYETVVE